MHGVTRRCPLIAWRHSHTVAATKGREAWTSSIYARQLGCLEEGEGCLARAAGNACVHGRTATEWALGWPGLSSKARLLREAGAHLDRRPGAVHNSHALLFLTLKGLLSPLIHSIAKHAACPCCALFFSE